MNALKNKKIVDMTLDGDTYLLDIAISKSFVDEWENYYFAMYQRSTDNYKIIPYILKEETDSYFIFHLEVSFPEYQAFLTEVEIVDLSIIRQRDDEEKRSRIKSNYDYIEFLKLELDESHIFYPSTTGQGNLSFYFREVFLFAKLEEVALKKDGLLQMKGMYHYSGLRFEAIKNIELIATSNLNDETIHIPVRPMVIPDSYAGYVWFHGMKEKGFQAEVDLKPYMSLGKAQFLKFYLKIEAEREGTLEVLESTRIKVNHLKQQYPLIRKLKSGSNKVKITAKPTKKSKYFSLKVAEYKLPIEMIRNAKKNWVALRRSKQLLKVYKLAFKILGLIMPVDKKLVIFESFHGKQFSDNPRAIYEYMKHEKTNYKLIWSVDRRHVNYFNGKDVTYVRRFSVSWLLLMSRAGYWVTNARLPLWIPKPRHTIYLQTWHGTPLKRLAADMEEVHMPGTNTTKYKKNFTKEASKWDYLISPNAYSSKIFRRAFQFNQEMIESGYPRNDYLYNSNHPEAVKRLKQALNIPENKKVILYAPTWRDNQFYGKGKYKFNLELDLKKLYEQFGSTHVIALRMHYLVAENLDISAYKGFVYDFSTYEDIRDLYLISDVLITDYSSVFFDYANLKRPMLFFVYDIEEYRDNLRGFYFDFETKAPGPLVKSTEEIVREIKQLETEDFHPSAVHEEFYNRFCYLEDGNASKRVVDEVFKE
ncbi:CDP-glycerol--glycerophosphate glycerophosphotransferase [Virgibacillus profundi]|uniref:CDP-glycerol--glycerophosphate glycerophosphotransferase n=1 Tax=Virgibacillus profundi TaxID=2024555 RepID=A0A2A2IIY2_9BACI|nr:CDP-glycerol glycerophosphotransferase family protein [Virgibacillus profundi]PAV31286.1 CDP-glycerol--glycerophosphate glycerophosphotransferase [Virgibacillus profundi]PXY55471.1 CDP-glycerol glycerophosphotransferase family protein [Virgibacillus profundi]